MNDRTKEKKLGHTGGSDCPCELCARPSNERVDSTELYYAEMEAARNTAEEAYFRPRGDDDNAATRRTFRAGFERAFRSLWKPTQDETTGAPDVNDMFRAGVTQAKYRRYYYEALLRVLNSDRMLSHDIARAAVDGSPEHLPEEPTETLTPRYECHVCGRKYLTIEVRDHHQEECTDASEAWRQEKATEKRE